MLVNKPKKEPTKGWKKKKITGRTVQFHLDEELIKVFDEILLRQNIVTRTEVIEPLIRGYIKGYFDAQIKKLEETPVGTSSSPDNGGQVINGATTPVIE